MGINGLILKIPGRNMTENISGFANLLFLKDKARPVDIDAGKLVTCMQLGVSFQLPRQYYAQVYILL